MAPSLLAPLFSRNVCVLRKEKHFDVLIPMGNTTIRNAVARGSWHLPTRINTSEQSNAVSTLRSSLILTNPKLTMLQWTMVHHNLTHNHFADYHYARPASTRLSQSQPLSYHACAVILSDATELVSLNKMYTSSDLHVAVRCSAVTYVAM